MANKNTSNGTSMEITLFIVFLIFKLTGVIDWSWWYVTMILWLPLVVIIIMTGIIGLVEALFN